MQWMVSFQLLDGVCGNRMFAANCLDVAENWILAQRSYWKSWSIVRCNNGQNDVVLCGRNPACYPYGQGGMRYRPI